MDLVVSEGIRGLNGSELERAFWGHWQDYTTLHIQVYESVKTQCL
jgi:hypothetical protein